MVPHFYELLFDLFAFVLGASIGSFLNVCIYRMPLGLSVNEPKRSFCPHCHYQIPFRHNLPLVAWLALRGRCANCGARISFRYFAVELLTGLLYLAIWLRVAGWGPEGWPEGWMLALAYQVMGSLFIVATFIDLEHFIIPDEITIGGTVAGLALSFALPALHGDESHVAGALHSLLGAAAGFVALWLVTRLGKMAFGKKRLSFDQAVELSWIRRGEEADFSVGEETMLWSEFFYRGNEQLLWQCPWIEIDGERFENAAVRCECDWLHLGERKWELSKVDTIKGSVTEVVLPREAMGFGDVKFIACIGAFLGWKAVGFTVMAASTLGAVIGLVAIVIGHREWSAKIPFGPYLAVGALLWLFMGPELLEWYWRVITPPL